MHLIKSGELQHWSQSSLHPWNLSPSARTLTLRQNTIFGRQLPRNNTVLWLLYTGKKHKNSRVSADPNSSRQLARRLHTSSFQTPQHQLHFRLEFVIVFIIALQSRTTWKHSLYRLMKSSSNWDLGILQLFSSITVAPHLSFSKHLIIAS